MILQLPDLRQRSNHDCGDVALRIILQYFRRKPHPPLACPIDGTDPRTLETAIRAAGIEVQSGEMTVADLRWHTRSHRPVACLVRHGATGHWVVVGGVDRGRVYYQCPADGWKHEKTTAFVARWFDYDRLGTTYRGWGLAAG